MIDDTQKVINKIHNSETSVEDILALLSDQRGIVRANVLFELPNREVSNNDDVVAALKEAATNSFSSFKFMGNVTQKKFAIATLSWIGEQISYSEMLGLCDQVEAEDIKGLVTQGPVSI